ncbi:MAG: DUF4190 domain-containing protein [Actinomycetota bacterium]|nr:DUF4190 domain-containing protein [Actinomycetota bacterium]
MADDRSTVSPSGGTGQGGHGYAPANRGTNGVAIAALVLGLLSVPLALFAGIGGLLGLVAIILGFVGVKKAKEMAGSGKGMAITGIVSGLLGLLLAILVVAGIAALFNNPQVQQELQRQQELQSELQQQTEGG